MERAARTVILRHDLPDGSWHYDWLIERHPVTAEPQALQAGEPGLAAGAGAGEPRDVLTFRMDASINVPMAAPFAAMKLSDHRRLYLEYEGRLPGEAARGAVQRVAVGEAELILESSDSIVVRVRWPGALSTYSGRIASVGDAWRFEVR